MNKPNKPDSAAFKRVCKELASGADFTMNMLGDVFGKPFYECLILCLMDAQTAARAIQTATLRLQLDEEEVLDDDDIDGEPN